MDWMGEINERDYVYVDDNYFNVYNSVGVLLSPN